MTIDAAPITMHSKTIPNRIRNWMIARATQKTM